MGSRLRFVPGSVVLALGLAGLLACSATPTDATGSSEQPIVAVGGGGIVLHNQPPVCTYDTPTNTTPFEFIDAWATAPTADGCPTIQGTNGVWAEIGAIPAPANIDAFISPARYVGVPVEWETNAPAPDCRTVAGMPANCCTYVWWPAGWESNPLEANPAPQDSSSLCTHNGQTFTALTYGPFCWWECSGQLQPALVPSGGGQPTVPHSSCVPRCAEPSGGGCASCAGFPTPR